MEHALTTSYLPNSLPIYATAPTDKATGKLVHVKYSNEENIDMEAIAVSDKYYPVNIDANS